ncbi:MAG TPA: T9SS type A sorting domain-containing protein [Flavobacterium sp.]
MIKKYLLLATLAYCVNSFGQAPVIQWQDVAGGSNTDMFRSVITTSDGHYVTVGSTDSNDGDILNHHGEFDVLLFKYDQTGNLLWKKTFGGTGQDNGTSVRQTLDGGFIICGDSESTDGDAAVTHTSTDYWIIKTDASGTLEWQKSFGGSGYDIATDIRQTSDGGYIVIGESRSNSGDVASHYGNEDIWILKLDSAGTLLWQKNYGGNGEDGPRTILQTPDGGYIFSSYTNSCAQDIVGLHDPYGCTGAFTNRDYWIVKLNASGNIVWKTTLGTDGNDSVSDSPESLAMTSDGGYIVCGTTNPVWASGGDFDFKIYKLSSAGAVEWEKDYGGIYNDRAYAVVQTADGGYVISGATNSNGGDVSGNHSQYYGSIGYDSDFWIIKTDAAGTLQWQKCYGGQGSETPYSMLFTNDGGLIVAGDATSNNTGDVLTGHGLSEAWLIKLSAVSLATADLEQTSFSVYPNPARHEINIPTDEDVQMYSITDVTGKTVLKSTAGSKRIDVGGLHSGIYILEFTSASGIFRQKFIKE